jgi:glycosyltransferase involved in cell wall biosynthesis
VKGMTILSRTPTISVVMAVYNGEIYLREALESIVTQTYNDFEFIIVDDGSTDTTPNILKEYKNRDRRIILLHNKTNLKLIRSLNLGLQKARGKYIARMDADDISLPERLEKQVAYLNSNDQVGLLGTRIFRIDYNGEVIAKPNPPQTDATIRWKLFYGSPFSHSSVMFRQSLLDKVGLYDQAALHAEDYAMWSKMARYTQLRSLSDILQKVRTSTSSISHIFRTEQNEMADLIACQNINNLMEKNFITPQESQRLRAWYHSQFNDTVTKKDISLCKKWIEIYKQFIRSQQNITLKDKKEIRQQLARRLAAIVYPLTLDSFMLWLRLLTLAPRHRSH